MVKQQLAYICSFKLPIFSDMVFIYCIYLFIYRLLYMYIGTCLEYRHTVEV